MTDAARALLAERSFDLCDRPAEILVQLLKSLVQRLELAGTGFVIATIVDVELFLGRGSEKGIVYGGQRTLKPIFAVGGITHTPTARYICRLPMLRVSLLIDCSRVGHSMAKAGRNRAAAQRPNPGIEGVSWRRRPRTIRGARAVAGCCKARS
jgi:hypothetical protein